VLTGGDIFPDIEVSRTQPEPALQPAGAGLPVIEATVVIDEWDAEEDEEDQESAIFVREARTEQLVTVIEILSYSNKTSGDEKRARYLLKRRTLLRSGIHLVEVDLLRWGQRVTAGLPNKPYHILVSRGDDRPHTRVWSFGLDEPIPAAPLPLIAPGEQVPIPLQEAFDVIYQARGFRHRLEYGREPEGPLRAAERAYVHGRLTELGLRSQ
jgi:hypothetical protein